ncbi:MAG: SAM-dependent methyltransferase [Campylobacteraceae bacterium 4484_4]|nr:MAG: SAM-dependent methyltransferase [Campylobacteraceae bacterium 4484_4]
MANIEPFEKLTADYDRWFEKHSDLYAYELEAIRTLLPDFQNGIEIGVGTGRFAVPLGIKTGLEPSPKMAKIAEKRGIHIIRGEAEAIPVADAQFDFALFVTTICFVDNPLQSLKEIHRILKPHGTLIVGFVDKNTPLGHYYLEHQNKSRFYKTARFFSSQEVIQLLKEAGFDECRAVQTLFGPTLDQMQGGVKDGYGEGAFVALRCQKREQS